MIFSKFYFTKDLLPSPILRKKKREDKSSMSVIEMTDSLALPRILSPSQEKDQVKYSLIKYRIMIEAKFI